MANLSQANDVLQYHREKSVSGMNVMSRKLYSEHERNYGLYLDTGKYNLHAK